MTMLFNAHQLQIMAAACGIRGELHQLERFARLIEIVVDEQWCREDCTGIPFEAIERAVTAERDRCLEICDNFDDPSDRIRGIIPEQAPNTGAPRK
jgi:hypothetical protein